MNTCAYIPPNSLRFNSPKSINENILNEIKSLPDGLRKEIRLLAKQYELLEFHKQPDDFSGEHIVRSNPYILKYRDRNTNEKFEWVIESERLYQ